MKIIIIIIIGDKKQCVWRAISSTPLIMDQGNTLKVQSVSQSVRVRPLKRWKQMPLRLKPLDLWNDCGEVLVVRN